VIYYAPLILGDKAQALFALPEFSTLGEAPRAKIVDVRTIEDDIRVTARFEEA
jgi:riboflavin biosynthesis pyrimidine reductase